LGCELPQDDAVESVINGLSKEKKEKGPMVVSSHTISNPKAVMVESLDTDLTFLTVLCSVVASYLAKTTVYLLRLR
jgi:hypothetical protein